MTTQGTTTTTTTTTKVIILTGASGYLGQHCLRGLIEDTGTAYWDRYCRQSPPEPLDNVGTIGTNFTGTACGADTAMTTSSSQSQSCASSASASASASTKILIYAFVHQSSSELADAVSSYYNVNEDATVTTATPTPTTATAEIRAHYRENVTVITVALDLTSETACREWFESELTRNNCSHHQHQSQQQTTATETAPATITTTVKIDGCIHTAALSSPAVCEQQPEYAMSINVPTHFFQLLFHNNPNITIVALSTDQVYDGNLLSTTTAEQEPSDHSHHHFYNEASECAPCNVYGMTKVALETYLQQQQKQHFPHSNIVLLRSSIILGPKAPYIPDRAHTTFLHFCHCRRNTSTSYYTNEIRSVIAVVDVVTVILHMIHKMIHTHHQHVSQRKVVGTSEIYCMGGPTPVNRYEMAMAVLSYCNDTDTASIETIAVPIVKEQRQQQSDNDDNNNSVTSPLNISMNSTKLLQLLFGTTMSSSSSTTTLAVPVGSSSSSNSNNNNTNYFLSLSDIVKLTFDQP